MNASALVFVVVNMSKSYLLKISVAYVTMLALALTLCQTALQSC